MNLVSIIIPNYNHAAFLQQRLDSVFSQAYQNFEVILLDDASTDASVDILKKYQGHPKVSHLVINETNSESPFKQWQKGIALAKGEYIWIAESDDYCEPVILDTLMKSFTHDIGLVYCQTNDVDELGEVILDRIEYTADLKNNYWENDFEMDGKEFIKEGLLIKNVIPNASAVVFKRSLIQPFFFSKPLIQMNMCGDWFFWIQLSGITNVKFVSTHLNYFRNHSFISRIHRDPKTKKRRLLEEAVVRQYAQQQYGLLDSTMNEQLYQKWFLLHTILAPLNSHFYKVLQPSTSSWSFIVKFIKFKFKNLKL